MKAVDYLKTVKRMCNFYTYCSKCPLGEAGNSDELDCGEYESDYPEKAVEIVEKWAKENPQKTYLSGLLEKFPNAELNSEGYPFFCAISIYGDLHKPNCTYTACRDCWNREIKESDG